MLIKLLDDPRRAGEISDVNHAAFGYPTIRRLTEHKIKERMKDPRYEAYGCISNDVLLGFFYLFTAAPTSRTKHVESFCVLPCHQGRGIGYKMAGHMIEMYSIFDFHLDAPIENQSCRRLYKKFGFIETGERSMARKAQPFMENEFILGNMRLCLTGAADMAGVKLQRSPNSYDMEEMLCIMEEILARLQKKTWKDCTIWPLLDLIEVAVVKPLVFVLTRLEHYFKKRESERRNV